MRRGRRLSSEEQAVTPLSQLGCRICILGPSNSGKSTLAVAIGDKLAVEVVHLDRLRHRPQTDWQPRPQAEFIALHDCAIAGEAWVMEGNYSVCLPQRLARATGVIVLDVSAGLSLLRYLRRCWWRADRAGGLDGGRDSVKWDMIRHIVLITPTNRRRYRALYHDLGLPKCRLASRRRIEAYRHREGL